METNFKLKFVIKRYKLKKTQENIMAWFSSTIILSENKIFIKLLNFSKISVVS